MLIFQTANCNLDVYMWKHLCCNFPGTLIERVNLRMDSKSILCWSKVTKTEYTPLDVHLQG